MPSIAQCLEQAVQLQQSCEQPLRETQLILSYCADMSLAQLYTWPEKELQESQYTQFCDWMAQRAQGIPFAYICGEKEFWSLTLSVEQGVLVPRPETELLLEACLERATANTGVLLDLGAGTGAIALAFASEKPNWRVIAVDANSQAVALATKNCRKLKLQNVSILHSDWFSALAGQQFDVIASNPPYIDATAPELNGDGVRYEPLSALVADDAGMSDINHIVSTAKTHLNPQGFLLFEHGYDQGELSRKALHSAGYSKIETLRDYAGHERVSLAQFT